MPRTFLRALLPLAALTLATPSFAQQSLYTITGLGQIYRIDDYATQPTEVLVGTATGFGSYFPREVGVDSATGDFLVMGTLTGFGGTSKLFRVDPVTFDATIIAPGFSAPTFGASYSMDLDEDGRGVSTGWVLGYLDAFDTVSSDGTAIAFGNESLSSVDIAFDVDGTVLIINDFGTFSRYDPVGGDLVDLGPHNLGSQVTGLEIDTDGTIYVMTLQGQLSRYDLSTMTATLLGDLPIFAQSLGFSRSALQSFGDVYRYCPYTVPNSTGQAARVNVSGSTVAADNNLTLHASDLPPNRFGVFVVSDAPRVEFPFTSGDGYLCMFSPVGLLRGPGQILNTGAGGTMQLTIDLANLPSGTGIASAVTGDRLCFQAWFRDDPMPAGSNYTDGIQVLFR